MPQRWNSSIKARCSDLPLRLGNRKNGCIMRALSRMKTRNALHRLDILWGYLRIRDIYSTV
jgi:hypothetical protein